MSFSPPEQFNMAEYFLDARIREGRGERPALLTESGTLTYRDVHALANRFGHVLTGAGVEPEQRVLIALPDGPEFVGALFGTLKIGAAVVMVNPVTATTRPSGFFPAARRGSPKRSSRATGRLPTPPNATPRA